MEHTTFTDFNYTTPEDRRARDESLRAEMEAKARGSADAAKVDGWIADIDGAAEKRRMKNERIFTWRMADAAHDAAEAEFFKVGSLLEKAECETDGAKRSQIKNHAVAAFRRGQEFDEAAKKAEDKVRVQVSIPDTYRNGSRHSFFVDSMLAAPRSHHVPGADEARARLTAYSDHVVRTAHPGNREGRALQNAGRTANGEVRTGMTSGSGSGGAFVTPVYLTEQYAKWRQAIPVVADFFQQLDLPAFGLTVEIPEVTATDAVSVVSEGSAIASTSPTGGYLQGTISAYTGSTPISQQLLDRAGPTSIDTILHTALLDSAQQQFDSALIAALIAAATTTVTRATTFGLTQLWSDIARAGASLETTAGTLLSADGAFLGPLNHKWFASQLDTAGHPVWQPDPAVRPNPQIGDTGYSIAGGTRVYTDLSLPTGDFLVSNAASALVMRGEPVVEVIPEYGAMNLQCLVRLKMYASWVIRFPSGTVPITGYPGSPSFS